MEHLSFDWPVYYNEIQATGEDRGKDVKCQKLSFLTVVLYFPQFEFKELPVGDFLSYPLQAEDIYN